MITLLTDFGLSDPYAGIMKGVICSVNPATVIIDLTHDIDPQDITHAAYLINAAYRYFPKGTIHVVVVDPGVGSDRSIIALSAGGHFFLAPDNGVLSLILDKANPEKIIKVENKTYFLNTVSDTFHGRDIFAPVAAHLSKGVKIDCLGTEINVRQTVNINLQGPYQSETGDLIGEIIFVDRFGNLITNIDRQSINQLKGSKSDRDLRIWVAKHQINGLSSSYQDVGSQSLLAIVGSMGFVEISVNGASASAYCGLFKGDRVKISTN